MLSTEDTKALADRVEARIARLPLLREHIELKHWEQTVEYVVHGLTGKPMKAVFETFYELVQLGLDHPDETLLRACVAKMRHMDDKVGGRIWVKHCLDSILDRGELANEPGVDALFQYAFMTVQEDLVQRFYAHGLFPSRHLLGPHYRTGSSQEGDLLQDARRRAAAMELRDQLLEGASPTRAPPAIGL